MYKANIILLVVLLTFIFLNNLRPTQCGLNTNIFKLPSQTLWILIPKIKTNTNKQHYFTDNH